MSARPPGFVLVSAWRNGLVPECLLAPGDIAWAREVVTPFETLVHVRMRGASEDLELFGIDWEGFKAAVAQALAERRELELERKAGT